MQRAASHDTSIGRRIHDRRKLLNLSMRHAADLAGISHSTWSRIEAGRVSADNRFTLALIAQALRCPLADLTGQPPDPVSRDDAETGSAVYWTMQAVIAADLRYPPDAAPQDIAQLEQETELVADLRGRCDYVTVAHRLPDLVAGLHATAYGQHRARALRALVLAEESGTHAVRYLGHPANACLVADRAQQAAEALEHPVMLAYAGWARAHAAYGCGLYDRGATIAGQAAAELVPHVGMPQAPEVLGMLYLTQAYGLAGLGHGGEAELRLAEAGDLAERTGDTDTLGLMFGPTNVKFWEIGMEADGDNPGRAIEIASTTSMTAIPRVSRQAHFAIDLGRALARERRDQEALRQLLAGERLAPQLMRDPMVIETVRGLLERARLGTGWTELRGLCARLRVGST